MKTKHWVVMLLVILLLIPWAALAAPVGKITNLAGNVDITSPGSAARDAKIDDPVIVGDFVRTKSKSKVEITFNEGNILRLAENTRVGITQYMSGEKQNSSILNLFRGKIQNIVKSVGISGGRYEVHTATSVCGVRGTHFFNFYLAGASGSIFQEGSGYGYSINNPTDVKLITAGQGMFVPSATLGAQLRSVSNNQLDEMKNATEILGGSGGSGDSGGSGGSGSSGGTGDSGGVGDAFQPLLSTLTTESTLIIPPVQTSALNLSIAKGDVSFINKIDNGTITGTTADGGTRFLTVAEGIIRDPEGGRTSTPDNPAGGLITGTIKTDSAITSGVSGYMMGLPNESHTSAKALLSAIYVNNDGQAGFLLGPMYATFTSDTFSGTGVVVKYSPIATTSFIPSTLAPNILTGSKPPSIGDVYFTPGYIGVGCSSAVCESESRYINVAGGIIGVWGSYSQKGNYYNSGITSFSSKRVISYNSSNKVALYSETLSGAVDTAAKEVSISGNFDYMSTLYKGVTTMNHFGYYDASNIYTSISSGTFQLQPMAWANVLSGVSGIIGSTGNIWTNASVPVTMIGTYSDASGYKVINGVWQSYNYRLGSGKLTNDGGGAYIGCLNTHLLLSSTNTINTDALALYADTSGNIGVLRGNVPGTVYLAGSAAGGFKAEGTLNRIEMATGTGVAAGTFVDSGTTSGSFTLDTAGVLNLLTGPSLTLNTLNSDWLGINSDSYNYWGIGKTVSDGTYTGDPRGNAVFSYYRKSGGSTKGSESLVYTQNAASTSWNTTDGGYFRGNIAGAATDWVSAATSVFGGTVIGVFSPATDGTWSATALSTRIETAKFIEMAATATGRTKLADLNIPSVIVGTTTLSGNGNGFTSLSINNMGFYASTSGGKPQIWASNNVSGTMVSVSVPLNVHTHLTGTGGFAADFTVRRFDTSKWAADISGTGGFNGSNTFQGGAAGTYSGTNVSGTASGTAH